MGYKTSRKHTVQDPENPLNIAKKLGDAAKKHVRGMSNTELDQFLTSVKAIDAVLSWSRARKLNLVRDSVIQEFARRWDEDIDAKKGAEHE